MLKAGSPLLALLALTGLNEAFAQDPKPVYRPATAFTLTGKIADTKHLYHRVDTAAYPALPGAVKKLLTNSAGLAITFKTNSTAISAKWCTSRRKASANMTAIAFEGLDLYIKKDGKWQYAGVGRPKEDCSEANLVQHMDKSEKECLLYLPLYDETTSLEIGLDPGASASALPDPFGKRVLIYGSSILQGASASRAGLAYPARLSRETGLNYLNLGLSGNGKMEPAVADMIAEIPADAYILDCVPNSSPQMIKDRAEYLVTTIRKHHPKAPIIMVQSIVREHGFFDLKVGQYVADQNKAYQEAFLLLQKKGLQDLYFIPGADMLGKDHEGTGDGTHPNDIGFDRMLQVLKPRFTAILKKYGI